MPKRPRSGASYGRATKRRKVTYARRPHVRRRYKARPGRALKTTYRGSPNVWSFQRETRPQVIDLGVAAGGITLLAGTGAIPNTSVLNLPNFQFTDLVNYAEFSALFASYKIDSIVTTLIPQWQNTVNPDGAGSGTTQIPNLMCCRINTKFLPNGFTLAATAEANRDKLAQVIKKSRSLYGSRKWLKLVTKSPLVWQDIEDGSGGVNLTTRRSPWLPTATAADQQYTQNDMIFFDSLSGIDIASGVYKYRYYHTVRFRCGFIG